MVVLDVHLPDADGLQAFDRVKEIDVRVPIVLITGHGTTDLAIEAMKRGAFDYLLKPLRYDQLKEIIARACTSSRLMTTPAVVADAEAVPDRADVLVGRCEAIQEVYKAIGRVAATDATVLILGESGTGKELVARAVYQHSTRGQARSSPSTAVRSPRTCSKANSSGTRRVRSPVRDTATDRQVRAVQRRHDLPG